MADLAPVLAAVQLYGDQRAAEALNVPAPVAGRLPATLPFTLG